MDDVRLLTKVATLYYKGAETQQEIADRLGLSRPTIGRHLKRAQDLGIVGIKINSALEYSTELECHLEKVFNLSEVIVVTPPVDTEESVKEALGKAAAAFLVRRVQLNDIIGVAWSSTVLQCVVNLPLSKSRHVTVVQLNGSQDSSSYSTRSEYMVEQIARAFDGTTASLVVPMLVDYPSIKESLLSDSHIAATLELARRSQIALFGVGNVSEDSSLFKAGYIDNILLDKLVQIQLHGECFR